MKLRTIFLPPGQVAPGVTLAATVFDKDGHALLSVGTVLDAGTLDRLSKRGVEAIAVLLPDMRDAATIAHELRGAEERVAHIFRGTGSPARKKLHVNVLRYRQESTQ